MTSPAFGRSRVAPSFELGSRTDAIFSESSCMTRPFVASVAQRSAVECVVPWTDDARYDAALFETAFEMLAEASPRFRAWLVPMSTSERPFSRYDATIEALRKYPQLRVWNERGRKGLDRLNATLDATSPGAIRVVADFGQPFRAADLAEALIAGKRRATAFGMGEPIVARMPAASIQDSRSIRLDGPQAPFSRQPVVVESETGGRRLRPVGNIRRIRTSGVS
jgi:hypothetical protein